MLNDGNQLIDLNFTNFYPLGDNTILKSRLFMLTGNGKWIKVFTIEEKKGLCSFLNAAMRDVWWNLQKAVGMPPGNCPTPKVCVSYKKYSCHQQKMNANV